jgi:hypothetical protein
MFIFGSCLTPTLLQAFWMVDSRTTIRYYMKLYA